VTASPSGGVGPYTYLWERVSGDTNIFPSGSISAATLRWGRSNGSAGNFNATWRCCVTDNLGTVAYSPNVIVEITFTS
jgi:hypothetical protein